MNTGSIATMRKRKWVRGIVSALLVGAVVVACVGIVDKNEAIDEAGLVMNYFRSLFAPDGTATTESNPDN